MSETVLSELAAQGRTAPGEVGQIEDDADAAVSVLKVLRQLGDDNPENDAVIGSTALVRGIPLNTGDRLLAAAVTKLGGVARYVP